MKPNPSMAETEDRREALWNLAKPIVVLLLLGAAFKISISVENDPTRGARRPGVELDTSHIVDTGFVLTRRIHAFLYANPFANDLCALINTLVYTPMMLYIGYVTLWLGDYGLIFRMAFTTVIRAGCGWFTYLPASAEYLQSDFDFPDALTSGAIEKLIVTGTWPVSHPGGGELIPFVSFFSGHVANMVMVGSHLYLSGHKVAGKGVHFANLLQIVRLLATRGHYSIDIIVGWIVAVYASNPAERLGAYFSRASHRQYLEDVRARMEHMGDGSWFESLIYADGIRQATHADGILKKPIVRKLAEAALAVAEKRAEEVLGQASVAVEREMAELKRHCQEKGIAVPVWMVEMDG